ncbi:hypothetical protein [Streptomyces hydrogenans]|uniref:hypothetical protein n=1 Tax=Streptomyces hydrogenans TaxID=1873719 RepID=UPI003802295E
MKRTHILTADATTPSGHLPWPLLDGIPTQPKPAPTRNTLVQAQFKQVSLKVGAKFTHRKIGNTVHVQYDPKQISALDVRWTLGLLVDYREGEKLDKLRELGLDAETNAIREIFDILLDQIDKYGDVSAVIACAEKLFTRVIAEVGE